MLRKKHPIADTICFFNEKPFLVFFQILGFAAESVKQQNQWDDQFEPVHDAKLINKFRQFYPANVIIHNKNLYWTYIWDMSLPLRITFEEKDYTYIVLTKSITKETSSIRISLGGEEYELTRNLNGIWEVGDTTVNDKPDLLKAIARNIKLRYRL